jgi:hypothetical protein
VPLRQVLNYKTVEASTVDKTGSTKLPGLQGFPAPGFYQKFEFFLDFLKQIHLVPGLVFPRVQGERTMMGWVYSWVDKKREQPTDWIVIEDLRQLI